MLLKDVHHRVKNNLQVISSLVSLQADGVNDPKMRRLFGDVRDRVRTMALVHERLYQSGSLAEVDFAEYAKSLLRALWRSHGSISENVRLRLELDPLKLSAEPATLCGLILTELASNALKHAFNDRADGVLTVRVEHNKTTGTACLRVRDDVPGLPAGLDWRKAQSLGLQLVQMLTGQMRGAVEMSDSAGVEFRVTFSTREQGAP
jgi:two-component sensor histidine kinase